MDYYLGEIRIFAGGKIPEGWALCDGTVLPINGNEALFSLLGTTFGGDGRINFGLPKLGSYVAIGQGQGPKLSNRVLGQTGGSNAVALATNNLPIHTHNVMVSTAEATASEANFNTYPAAPSAKADVLYIKPTITQTPALDHEFGDDWNRRRRTVACQCDANHRF